MEKPVFRPRFLSPLVVALLLLSLGAGPIRAADECAFFLHDDATFDQDDAFDLLDQYAPVTVLPDPHDPPDFDADNEPGLTIKRFKKNPQAENYQEWISDPQPVDLCLSGLGRVQLFATIKDFKRVDAGAATVLVLDRDPDTQEDTLVGQAGLVLDPYSFSGDWEEKVFLFVPRETDADPETEFPYYRLAAGRQLVLKVIVGANLTVQDVWFSYDSTDHPSRLVLASCDCDDIQPPVDDDGDWTISGADMYSGPPGNVGIGTEEPAEKLDVQGSVRLAERLILGDGAVEIGHDPVGSVTASSGILHIGGDPLDEIEVLIGDTITLDADDPPGARLTLADATAGTVILDAHQWLGGPASGGGAALILKNSDHKETVLLDADEEGGADNAARMTLGNAQNEDTVILDAHDGTSGGGLVRLQDVSGDDRVQLDAHGEYGGAELRLWTAGGQDTALLNAHRSTGGAVLYLAKPDGERTVSLSSGAGDNGASLFLHNADGDLTVAVEGDGAQDEGRIMLLNASSEPTILLDADWEGTGEGRVVTSTLMITGGSDLAEPFEVPGEGVEPGMVLSIDPDRPGKLRLSRTAYDRTVAGVVSGAGGLKAGLLMVQDRPQVAGHAVALSGRVYCLADATYGAIRPGDLLTTSDTAGHAMRVARHRRARGAVLGKAMSPLEEGRGLVLVLVGLQ